jgi:hypothetical protein
MATITLSPPAEGVVVQVPLGTSKVFTFTGRFVVTPDASLTIAVAAGGRTWSTVVDPDQGTFQAAITLTCPDIVLAKATLHSREWVVGTGGHGHWLTETVDSNTVTVTVQDTATDPEHMIVVRCVNSAGRALVGLQVEAFDQDPNSPDNPLGGPTITDPDGLGSFRFRQSALHPGKKNPDVFFRIHQAGTPLGYDLPGEPNVNGVMHNFAPRMAPVMVHVQGVRAFVVQEAIRAKWLSLGANTGFLGLPLTDELTTPDGRGRYNHFVGGSIYWTPEWGAFEVHGLIRQAWADLRWEQGFLGFPVSDEEALPGSNGGRYSLFEHGIVTWEPGQAKATPGPHHYERLYAQVRAQILARFFAIGHKGRRNHLSQLNILAGPVAADQARWRIVGSGSENPLSQGALLNVALAVEHDAGNGESTRALEAGLATIDSLLTWVEETGAAVFGRLPQRWDAGLPTDWPEESDQFLDGGNGAYANALPASDIHHYARRDPKTLEALLGPSAAARYIGSSERPNISGQGEYCVRYRAWELSMDELVGLATSYWAIAKLSPSPALAGTVKRQANFVGNYLADNGYILVRRPMGGLAWRGSTGVLPFIEYPLSRALGFAAGGADFTSRTDFRGAMTRAGYWPLLEGPITNWQVAAWTLTGALLALAPAAQLIGLAAGGLEAVLAGQVVSPSTIGGALAVYLHSDCFDVSELGEPALALIARDAPNKPALYRAFALAQAQAAAVGAKGGWSSGFPPLLGLTGLDDSDATARDTFREWFAIRQANPATEIKGLGSQTLFAAGVAALLGNDTASEERLVALLEQAIVELFRDSYFEPALPVSHSDDGTREWCLLSARMYQDDSRTPYSPLDLLAGLALAFWHAKSRAGSPVTTVRFPEPLSAARFAQWPKPVGPDGYALFDGPTVARRMPPPPNNAWNEAAVPTIQMCDQPFTVRATDAGDVATGVTLFPGHEIQIDASGDIWAGAILDPRNGPAGLSRPIHDARWPLHTGIDPAANAFCLLGRLNGYFSIGTALPRTRWVYHAERPLYLRINDNAPGDGNGEFNVRIQVWGPQNFDPARVFRPPNVLVDGGVLRTSESADLIEVAVTLGAVGADAVEFELVTPDGITWRKEIVIQDAPATGTGTWTVWTQDARHRDANGLYLYQLPGATLTFRKQKTLGIMSQVLVLGGLQAAAPGSRISFDWVRD